jgi:hypothetical protein
MIQSDPIETVLFAVGTAAVRVLSFYAVSVAGMALSLFFVDEDALFFALPSFPVSLAFAGAAWGLFHPLLFIPSLGLICWYVSTFYRFITTTESLRCLFIAFSIPYWLSLGISFQRETLTPSIAALLYCVLLKAWLEWPWLQERLATEREVA